MKLLISFSNLGLRTVILLQRVDLDVACIQVGRLYPGEAVVIVKELAE